MQKRRAVVDDLVEQYGEYCSTFTFKLRKGIKGEQIHKEGFVNCFWEKNNKLVYLHVDKCGSTSITSAFRKDCPNFFSLDNSPRAKDADTLAKYFVETDHIFFAITRDPVERWISGLNEFMCRYKPPLEWIVSQIKNKKYIFDEHTGPQKVFLRLCLENNGKLKLIKLDQDLSPKVNVFIKNHIIDEVERFKYKPFIIPHLRNSRYFVPNYKSICNKIYHNYIEPDKTYFDSLYKDDYELYASGV
jgi:hypothetical protein